MGINKKKKKKTVCEKHWLKLDKRKTEKSMFVKRCLQVFHCLWTHLWMAFTHKYNTLAPSSVETGCGKMFSLERIQISIFLLDKFICSVQGQCSPVNTPEGRTCCWFLTLTVIVCVIVLLYLQRGKWMLMNAFCTNINFLSVCPPSPPCVAS